MKHFDYPRAVRQAPDWAATLKLDLDVQQRAILDPSIRRGILNCCRQWGKSTTIALKAAHFAATHPGSTVLVVSPSARQSEELLAIAAKMLRDLDIPATYSQSRVTLANGSRILALPNQPQTIRGYSPQLLVVDEAAYLPEEIWDAVLPMLNAAEGGGYLWLMSTPAQPTGFFHRIWTNKSADWTRLQVTALECPRISAERIEEGRRSLPPERFAREYLCQFAQPATAAFPEDLVRGCVDPGLVEFFASPLAHPLPAAPRRAQPHSYIGLDLGFAQDPSAIAIAEFVSEPTNTVDPATRAPFFRCSLALRYLESPALGTPYLDVAARALAIARHPRVLDRCTLVPDAGGPGAPVVELLRRKPLAAPVAPVLITGGNEVTESNGTWHVAKAVLMSRLEYLLRLKKLRIAPGPLTDAFLREITLLEREVRESGNVTFSTPSSKVHDDLVMATALAVWRAWEVHSVYLDVDGLVPIVSDAGVLHCAHHNPLYTPNHAWPKQPGRSWSW